MGARAQDSRLPTTSPVQQDDRSAMSTAAAIVLTAAAAWVSQGAMAFGDDGSARLAILPLTTLAAMLVLFAAVAVFGLLRVGASPAPLVLLFLAFLPWLPLPVPPAVLVWSGPVLWVLWIGVAAAMLATVRWQPVLPAHHPALRAGVLALAVYSCVAFTTSASRPSGDETRYLFAPQTLAHDRDLRVAGAGGLRVVRPSRATIPPGTDAGRRGLSAGISTFAPGIAVVVWPAFALAGYGGAVVWLVLLSAAAAALAFHLAWRVTGSTGAAWFGWAAIVFAPPVALNAFTVYPDGAASLIVLTGVWALLRLRDERDSDASSAWPWFLHGAALALLPWLQTRLAIVAVSIGGLVMLDLARTRNPAGKATAFLTIPSVSALAWLMFLIAVYGAPDPALPYRGADLGSPANIPGGLGGLLFDQMYGLFPNAPVLLAVPAGMVLMARRRGADRRLAAQLAFVVLPYVLVVTHFPAWWGGFGSPARLLVALLPAGAIPAAAAWSAARSRTLRAALAAALVVTATLTVCMAGVDGGRLAYFDRSSVYALWAEWATRTADLTHAFPSYFARVQRQQPGGAFFIEAAVWIGALTLACLALHARERTSQREARGKVLALTAGVLAMALMAAATAVWRVEGVTGTTLVPAAMGLLRELGSSQRRLALDLTGRRVASEPELRQRVGLRMARAPRPAGGPRDDRALFTLPLVPAGDYRIRAEGGGSGWLMAGIGIGRDQFALVTQPLGAFEGDVTLRFPVDVRALVVRGDEDASAHVRTLRVEPLSIRERPQTASDGLARRAVRYGSTTAYFMDDRSAPEPGGFWLNGTRQSTVVLQPDESRRSMVLVLVSRATGRSNAVDLRAGAWRHSLQLSPGEEQRLEIPVDASPGAASLTFVVSPPAAPEAVLGDAADPSRGVWVRVE
jgi:hypothetical protein